MSFDKGYEWEKDPEPESGTAENAAPEMENGTAEDSAPKPENGTAENAAPEPEISGQEDSGAGAEAAAAENTEPEPPSSAAGQSQEESQASGNLEPEPSLSGTAGEERTEFSAYPVPVAGQREEQAAGQSGENGTAPQPGYSAGQNHMAMASMVCGIVSFLGICCCGIGGIVLGSLAVIFGLLSRTGDRFETRAVAGIAAGAAAAVISVVVIAMLLIISAAN